MGDKEKIAELSAEVERLAAELVRAGQREADLADTRRAMLYLLEDINEGAALTENAKKEWEATFDSISDLLFIHDPQMRITRCNKAYMEAAGVKFKEIIGRPYYEVFPRMDGPFEPCREAPARGAGEAEEQEVEVEESGKVFKVRYYPVKGVATGASSIHVMEDITFEKRAATALKESEDKYRHLFDNLYDAAFLADAATGRIIETNKTGEALLGMTREEIIGMHQSALHPRGKEKEYREKFAAHVAKGHEADHEGEVVRKDGTVVQVAISGERLDIGGRDVMLGIFRDITVQKRNEEKIAQEMELTRDLLMIANATAHTTDIDRLMEQVVGCLKNIMRSKLSLSYVWNPERGVFSPSQAAGLSPGQTPFYRVEPLDHNVPFVAKAVETRRAVIENISGYPRLTVWTGAGRQEEPLPTPHKAPPKPPPGAPLHWIEGLNTIVVFPLIGREGCLGLLLSVYAGEKGLPEFASRDREVWDGISYQVSIALDEARLYKDSIDRTMELSRKIETIQMMHEIDNAILSALEPGEILDTAASMVAKAVYCEMTAIFLVDKEKSGFRFAAGFGTRLEKGFFMPFDHSSVKDVLKTGIPQYVARFKEADGEKAYERSLVKDGIASRISVPLVVKGEVTGVLSTCSRRAAAFSAEDLSVVEKLSSQIGIALENARLLTDIEELFFGTVKTLSEAIDAKSPWTRGHSERVTELAMAIGRELGLGKQELRYLELAGLLHDIGKLGTYESILDKPGRLTEEEQEIMKQHPAKGAEILSPIKQMAGLAPAIKHHHEFYDGTGYPAGLKGEEIPFMARILTVADTVDAMGADRPYRKGKPMSAIVAELKHCSGTQFDPLVVDTFLRIQEAGGARAGA